jgi:hypothetical protein
MPRALAQFVHEGRTQRGARDTETQSRLRLAAWLNQTLKQTLKQS